MEGDQTDGNQLRMTASVEMKVNLGNYESASAFISLQGIAPDTSVEEMETALETGKLAWGVLKNALQAKVVEMRAERGF